MTTSDVRTTWRVILQHILILLKIIGVGDYYFTELSTELNSGSKIFAYINANNLIF